MLLWSIEPKIVWNRLLTTIESKNQVAIMIISNSGRSVFFSPNCQWSYTTLPWHCGRRYSLRRASRGRCSCGPSPWRRRRPPPLCWPWPSWPRSPPGRGRGCAGPERGRRQSWVVIQWCRENLQQQFLCLNHGWSSMLELTLKPMNMYMYVDILTSIMDTLFPGLPFLVEFNSNFAKKRRER